MTLCSLTEDGAGVAAVVEEEEEEVEVVVAAAVIRVRCTLTPSSDLQSRGLASARPFSITCPRVTAVRQSKGAKSTSVRDF